MDKHRFCGYCGEQFAVLDWPRVCQSDTCGQITYRNPTPVVICLQPIWDRDNRRYGLAIAQRAIEPQIGKWSLIAGHIEDNAETVEEAAEREFNEETSLNIGFLPMVIESRANGKGHLILVVESDPIDYSYFLTGKPCPENYALDVLWEPRTLAFPIHTDLVAAWFSRR